MDTNISEFKCLRRSVTLGKLSQFSKSQFLACLKEFNDTYLAIVLKGLIYVRYVKHLIIATSIKFSMHIDVFPYNFLSEQTSHNFDVISIICEKMGISHFPLTQLPMIKS